MKNKIILSIKYYITIYRYDIEYYDWNNQTIIFKKESGIDCKPIENFEHNHQTLSSFATTSRDKFYIYVDDEFIYDGYYAQSVIRMINDLIIDCIMR